MVASIQIDGLHNRLQLGLNRNMIPSMAPSRKSPLRTSMKNMTKGAEAVKMMTFPDVFAPSLMTKWQMIREQT